MAFLESKRIKSVASALRAAIGQRATERASIEPVPRSQRIDGKVCLVTGANSGLGKAVAIDLAERGGVVLMACRGGHPEAGEEVKRRSSSEAVRMLKVDLADLSSIHRLCDELRSTTPRIDIAVLNAGLMPRRASRSKQGFELMFAVHFLANRVLVDRLLEDGLLNPSDGAGETPRIILVSSETHRNAEPIDFGRLGAFANYPFKDGLKHYGQSKLAQCTFAQTLSRRLNPEPEVRIAVHALCPGPINSNIAHEAPMLLKPLLSPVMKVSFLDPAKAALPVTYLCCAKVAGERTGLYLHMMREKAPAPEASDPQNGAKLWSESEALMRPFAPDPS